MLIPRRALLLGAVGAALVAPRIAVGLEPDPRGFYLTGSGVRLKRVGPFSVKVYAISHFMRQLPPTRSKQVVIDMDVDKNFTWRMLRDLDAERIQGALREAFAINGYHDQGNVGRFVGAFTHPIAEGRTVGITYASAARTTTIQVQGDGAASIAGIDFMRATWSIWFGKIDQPALGDDLLRNLPTS